jgi:hypothetical protein
MSKHNSNRAKVHADEPETPSLTKKGVEAISFFSRQLGGFPCFGSDPIFGLTLSWDNEEAQQPMAKLFLGPQREHAAIESRYSDELFTIIGWCLCNGFAYRLVDDSEVCAEDESAASGNFGLARLSVAAAKLEKAGETVRRLKGAVIEPAEAEGARLNKALAAHSGLFVVYRAEDDAPDRLMCGLISLDADWLTATAAAIAHL